MSPESPLYPLRDVCDLAKAGKVGFSRQAQKDYQQLGFGNDQAKEVVAWITANEFSKRIHYEEQRCTYDVYLCPRKLPDGRTLVLYVKLKIPSPSAAEYVYVTSFHL